MLYLFVRVLGEKPFYGVVGFEDGNPESDDPGGIPICCGHLHEVASVVRIARRMLDLYESKVDRPVIVYLDPTELMASVDATSDEPPTRIYFDERIFVLRMKPDYVEGLRRSVNLDNEVWDA